MIKNRKNKLLRFILIGILALTGLCVLLAAGSALYNALQPAHSSVVERISAVDKARLSEALHLRQSLGNQVLPGWAQADIPVILYNESYLFLVGIQDPADGWLKIPQGNPMGGAWEMVSGDDFNGLPYYRQRLPASGQSSQAFTVQVGSHWAASLTTFEWMRIAMADEVRGAIPGPLKPIVPVGLFTRLLVPGSDVYINLILHESIHAYQGIHAPDRLVSAERAMNALSSQYPWENSTFREAWQKELDLLNQALRASSREETLRLARAFLDQRTARREAAGLAAELVDLERQREWEEGISKYGELSIALLAARTPGYQPLHDLSQDPEFHRYQGAQKKWDQEIEQIRREAGAGGDGRFYYAGFAQAVLLDSLSPGWKEHLFDEAVWLEDLLAKAINPS